jgi:endogenous inhibitor of DNA gyrase (YacG/DUF329 family)
MRCKDCGEEIVAKQIYKGFCNRKCYTRYMNRTTLVKVKCKHCRKEFEVPRSAMLRYCSKDCKKKHVKVMKIERHRISNGNFDKQYYFNFAISQWRDRLSKESDPINQIIFGQEICRIEALL